MTLIESVSAVLLAEGVTEAAVLPFSECRVTRPDKLALYGFAPGTVRSALIVLIPYHPGKEYLPEHARNVSLYAVGRDYHDYFRGFFSRVCSALGDCFPDFRFSGSADNAPIDERHAAIRAGLGILGDNGLLINETYGSFVFIGEIFSDLPPEMLGEVSLSEPRFCEHCGACASACPMKQNPFGIPECLSAVTQTKHPASDAHLAYIRYYGSAWGCDRCQTVCPHNRDVPPSPIPYFHEALLPHLTIKALDAMTDEEFSARAYAWRGRPTVRRNLLLLEETSGTIPCRKGDTP